MSIERTREVNGVTKDLVNARREGFVEFADLQDNTAVFRIGDEELRVNMTQNASVLVEFFLSYLPPYEEFEEGLEDEEEEDEEAFEDED